MNKFVFRKFVFFKVVSLLKKLPINIFVVIIKNIMHFDLIFRCHFPNPKILCRNKARNPLMFSELDQLIDDMALKFFLEQNNNSHDFA